MQWRVKYNFVVCQPKWTNDYKRRFGERNDGFLVEAQSIEEVKNILREQNIVNPFYVTIYKECSK